jgi:hypothetical protein
MDTNPGTPVLSREPPTASTRTKESQAWILLGMGAVLFGVAVAISLVSTPGSFGIPNYTYFNGGPAETVVEAMVIVSAVWIGIAFAVLFKSALLVALLGGVAALVLWAALFVITFLDCKLIGSGTGALCVQTYPQTALVGGWGVSMLFCIPLVWLIQRQARKRLSRHG